ncbi:chorismate mutase [Candidatus Peregrinibacteria bacterium]|nr:chorismate mutase [Candidatus Peregrinibacteria bacterium]
MKELKIFREQIDEIDGKLAALLQKRAEMVRRIKFLKTEHHLAEIDREREKQILDRLETDYEKNIFRTILNESKKL